MPALYTNRKTSERRCLQRLSGGVQESWRERCRSRKSAGRRQMRVESDKQQIVRLFEDGDRALIAADLAELSCIFGEDYIQYDETGRPSTREEVLNNLKSGFIRYLSMISTGREIRLLGENVAVVHGSEEDE